MKLLIGILLVALPLYVASDEVVVEEAPDEAAAAPGGVRCINDPYPKPCPKYWDPVCGSNNKDYRNICYLRQQSVLNQQANKPPIYPWYRGVCFCNCQYCNSQCYKPVCGSDRVTYWNKCWLQCQRNCNLARQQPWIWQVYPQYCITPP